MPPCTQLLGLPHACLKNQLPRPIRVVGHQTWKPMGSPWSTDSINRFLAKNVGSSNQWRFTASKIANTCSYSFFPPQRTKCKPIVRQAACRSEVPRPLQYFHHFLPALETMSQMPNPNETPNVAPAESNINNRSASKCTVWSRTYVITSNGGGYQTGEDSRLLGDWHQPEKLAWTEFVMTVNKKE